uniref:Uncharacterized protein n=1 Tax=Knipowitschia caucasica TaxID=637954 RepID=A0AAV2J1P6_KNICA
MWIDGVESTAGAVEVMRMVGWTGWLLMRSGNGSAGECGPCALRSEGPCDIHMRARGESEERGRAQTVAQLRTVAQAMFNCG